jgi:glycosyltransferase involved in cell wall biosynthesis
MTAVAVAEEPTQATIRALLEEWTSRWGPADVTAPVTQAPPGEALRRAPAELGSDTPQRLPRVAYVLPGLPPEGSGGSHSLVQEARGMRALGARTWICVPADSLATAISLYGGGDRLFVPYPESDQVLPGVSDAAVGEALADADVAVATEYPSVDLLARLQDERPWLVCAYYVQDYEPLFAAPESTRADRALLSYRAHPRQLLFAKTRWLCELVGAVHGVPVAKVAPSLDRALFHPVGRRDSPVMRVAAMIRPRTPRRRPAATLEALAIVARELGDAVRIGTFGCDADAFAQLGAPDAPGAPRLGLLSRGEVAELMRRSDVFVDASAYQAFGRTGLEAMACGAVPLLPALGGVHEYAVHGENAMILADGAPREIADAVIALAHDPDRLWRLREAGTRAAEGYSIERAARSQLDLFVAALHGRFALSDEAPRSRFEVSAAAASRSRPAVPGAAP